jgi:hypothetical protein
MTPQDEGDLEDEYDGGSVPDGPIRVLPRHPKIRDPFEPRCGAAVLPSMSKVATVNRCNSPASCRRPLPRIAPRQEQQLHWRHRGIQLNPASSQSSLSQASP